MFHSLCAFAFQTLTCISFNSTSEMSALGFKKDSSGQVRLLCKVYYNTQNESLADNIVKCLDLCVKAGLH